METRQELILKFMLAIAGTDEIMEMMRKHDPDMAVTTVYLRAAKFADEYLSMQ